MPSTSSSPDRTPAPLRAVAYVRVSMTRHGMISPELQMQAITEYCARRGHTIVAALQDLDLSGRFWQRRQVEQAISMIETDQADVLVVWRWSRVTRNRLDWAVAVDRVEAAGGRLESATEGFDATTTTGRFARGILAEFAAFESDRMGDVWREVRDRRARLGLPVTGHQQFGYRKVNGCYLPHRRTGPVLVQLYRRYNAGESHHALVRWLNGRRLGTPGPRHPNAPWSHTTLARMMDTGFAAGLIRADGQALPGAHKPLITHAEWQAYQVRRAATRWRKTPQPDTMLLTGMLWCRCGASMAPVPTLDPGKYRAKYRCRQHPAGMPGGSVVQHRLEPLVHDWVTNLAQNPTAGAAARHHSRAFADAQWSRTRALQRDLTTAAPEADCDALEQARRAALAQSRWRDPVELAQALAEDWDLLTVPRRRQRLRDLVGRIVVHNQYSAPFIVLNTVWQESIRYTGAPRPAPASLTMPDAQREASAQPEPAPVDHTQYLTPREAASMLAVTTETLNRWRRDGMLPNTLPIGVGRGNLYSPADLRRVAQAPRGRSRGIDHTAVLRQITSGPAGPEPGPH